MSKTIGNVIDPIVVIKEYNKLSENSVLGENLIYAIIYPCQKKALKQNTQN
jgi:hypothetical protein